MFLEAFKFLSKDRNFQNVTETEHGDEAVRDAFIRLQSNVWRARGALTPHVLLMGIKEQRTDNCPRGSKVLLALSPSLIPFLLYQYSSNLHTKKS